MKQVVYLVVIILTILLIVISYKTPFKYDNYKADLIASVPIIIPTPFVVTHIATPDQVKAIYISSWVAGNKKLRNNLIRIVDETEINSVVIDIKDYTGKISFKTSNIELSKFNSSENRIPDIKEFIGLLHDKGIYVIGRISSFQDSYLVNKMPDMAVLDKSGKVWKDKKGISWLDVGARPVWEYLALIGQESYDVGFDELNFDYIRFPSDGNMEDIKYPFSQGKVKSEALKEFYAFLDEKFRTKNIPISADLFGMTTSSSNDLGIGQILVDALEHFDFVAPMVYPSHYPNKFLGFEKPATEPYEVIKYAMSSAIDKAKTASSTISKLRPWLQDFSIGRVSYTPEMVRAQIQATYDTGLDSWMLWNASNIYSEQALNYEN